MTRLLKSNKVFWLLSVPVLSLFILLSVLGSRILISPGKLEVTPCGDVVLFRDYPMSDWFGYPMIRYVTTITPLTPETNRGYVCREDNGEGHRFNHDYGRGFGKWSINHYAEPCMRDPLGFTMNIKYTALLFDLIPLRPINVDAIITCSNTEWETCPFRRQHDSPHT
jgi:hypothetical protein